MHTNNFKSNFRDKYNWKKYELWDLYETEIEGYGNKLYESNNKDDIMTYAKQYYKETNGECKLFMKEWE